MLIENPINVKSQENVCPSFSISKYVLFLILPKCVMVGGETVSSVYLQIAVNINHKKDAKKWMEKKSWMGIQTISKITGYNSRTVNKAIQILIDLGLLEKSYHGKLKMFALKNDNLTETKDIQSLVLSIENKLLKDLDKEKVKQIKKQFGLLNSKFYLSSTNSKSLTKKVWFDSINDFRNQIKKAESVYKGSSLFYVNLLWEDSVKKNSKKTDNKLISECDRSLLIGCSQPTLNRYISAYEKSGLLMREKDENSRITKLKLNFEFDEVEEQLQLVQEVVNKMSDNKRLYCPICDIDFETPRSLSMHITKSQNEEHQKLIEIKKENNFNAYETIEFYVNHYCEGVTKPQQQQKEEIKDSYMKIPCQCTMTCNSCFKNWKADFFDGCSHPRKEAYIEEYEINPVKKEKVKAEKKKNESPKEEAVGGFDVVPTLKKVPSQDTAPALVKYFYDLTGNSSPNWSKEGKQIKNLLTHNKLSPDQIRVVLSYMARKNHIDLRFLSTSVSDALLEQKYLSDMEQEGTAAYLLKMYYSGLKLQVNMQNLIKEVSKIQETMNSGLSYEDTKIVIDYMISIKCPTINFIAAKRTEALANKNGSGLKPMVKTAQKSNIKENPSFYDQDDVAFLKDELAGGRTSLKKVRPDIVDELKETARQILLNGKYNNRYIAFEWAWKVGLELDSVTYQAACSDVNKEPYLDYLMKNSSRVDPNRSAVLQKAKIKFDEWLNEQHKLFGKCSQNS